MGNNRYIKIRTFAGEKTPAKASFLLTFKEDQQGRKINDVAKDDELTMYPNPATNELTIESKMQNAEIEIRDVLGQMVYSTKAIASSSTIDISMLSKGVYFISLQNGKQTINKKLVKE